MNYYIKAGGKSYRPLFMVAAEMGYQQLFECQDMDGPYVKAIRNGEEFQYRITDRPDALGDVLRALEAFAHLQDMDPTRVLREVNEP